MAYTTKALVKVLLGIASADTDDDDLIDDLIEQSQDIIDSFTFRTFEASADTTRTFDADSDVEGRNLYLDDDLASITSITNGDADVLTTSEYTTEPRNTTPIDTIQLLPSSGLSWQSDSTTGDSEDAISIVGKWAYSATAPNGIVRACQEMAVLFYRQRDTSGDLNRTIIAGTATILPAGLSVVTTRYLQSVRRIV